MKRYTQLHHLLVAAAAAALLVSPLAHAGPAAPDVPGAIAVEEGHKVFLVGHAVGVQIYSCGATQTGFAWALLAPRADLYDDKGKLVATHYGGPTWKARDGSTVVGQRVDGVNVDPTAIDWLLLSARSTAAGAGRRPAHRNDVHPADEDDGRSAPERRDVQRVDRRHDGGGPVHRRLPLLEGDGALSPPSVE